jgi:hypothetical protein
VENSILSAEDLANTLKQLTLDLTKLYYDGIAKKNNYAAIKDFLEKDQYKEKLTKKVENFLLDLEKASIPDTAVDLFDRSVISCHLIRAWLDFFTCISNADKSHSLDSHFRNSAAQYALSKLPPDLLGYIA